MTKQADKAPSLLLDAKRTRFNYTETREADIDWISWLSRPCVELWEGIALSLGLNPTDKFPMDLSADFGGRQFEVRLKDAIEHLRPGGLLRELEQNDRKHLTRVLLIDISKLAKNNNWELPADFPKPDDSAPSKLEFYMVEIINKIQDRGLNPLALPKQKNGYAGIKSEIKKEILNTRPFIMSESNFKKAWEELLKDVLIKYIT